MKNLLTRVMIALALLALSTINDQLSTAFAQGTAFTYQGQLQNNGSPANGSYDLTFTLYNASNGGIGLFGPLTNSAIPVTNGLFTTTLDFGSNAFGGVSWWLQIGVRTNGGASFAPLTPRQQVTPTPYAIYSENSGAASSVIASSVSAGSLFTPGAPASGQVLTYNGSSLAWSNPPAGGGNGWSLTGNSGTIAGTNFLGTSDNEALELWVNGTRAFRLEPGVYGYPNVVGGSGTSVSPSALGGATIAGGNANMVSANSELATIGGGYLNIVSNNFSTVSGGEGNHATANEAVVGGGYVNTASGGQATVSGGVLNTASGVGAVISGGGWDGTNLVGNSAGGAAATVPGGQANSAAGNYSLAAGNQAMALHTGAFVWADTEGTTFSSTTANQFNVRANGGVRFVTGGAGMTIDGVPVSTGGGGGGGSSNGWSLSGNAGTDPSVNFLGTTDGAGLAFRVNSQPGLRLNYADGLDQNNDPGVSDFCINVNGGFWQNAISSGVVGATIAGGGTETYDDVNGYLYYPNKVTSNFGTVGGGNNNSAEGYGATVPGGYGNTASGKASFAAGQDATASDNNSFVWSDGTRGAVSQGSNSFAVLATGGAFFYTTTGNLNVEVDPNGDVDFGTTTRQMLNLYSSLYGIGVQSSTMYQRTAAGGGFAWFAGGVHNNGQDNPGGGTTVMTLDGSGDLNVTANASVCTLTIRGGCDLAEPFQFSGADKEIPQGAVVVIDEANPGHLKLSDQPYDSRVAGVVSGANGINPGIQMQQQGLLEGGKNVALTGRVYVQADTSNGPIKPGDLLTSSRTPGHAMKVSDHAKAQGAILGKAMTALDEGQGMVLVLVTLQ